MRVTYHIYASIHVIYTGLSQIRIEMLYKRLPTSPNANSLRLQDYETISFDSDSPRDKMQRPGFPPTATSPPLHHPVPQHVSSIPMMRSPPPPPGSATGYTSYGPQHSVPQPGITPIHPAYGGFFNDHTAQMGFQVGRTAYMAGQEYVEQNVCCISGIICGTTISGMSRDS